MFSKQQLVGTGCRLGGVLIYALLAVVAGLMLHSMWSAFTWSKFHMYDYGVYTNMMYNTAHGDWFRVLIDRSYLNTHLSFTLALPALLFHVWDHPFLLSALQWLALMGGGLLLFWVMRRFNCGLAMQFAVLFFWVMYPFTQSVMLSEFHGIAVYYLLVPWLYVTLVSAKRWSWLPWALILGVREDAFIFILPIVLYFAVRDRWRAGYVMFALSIFYGAFAILGLYPAITGMSLFDRRSGSVKDLEEVMDSVTGRGGRLRLQALLWTLLPVLAFTRRRLWRPVIFFPLAALLTAMLSGFWRQQGLLNHYPAPVMVCLAVGMVEALRVAKVNAVRLRSWRWATLMAVTVVAHLHMGYLVYGGRHAAHYHKPHVAGIVASRAARHIPKEGVLIMDNRDAAFCANRADIVNFRKYRKSRHAIDVVFTRMSYLKHRNFRPFLELVKTGEMGMIYTDGVYVVLQRGAATTQNARLLDRLKYGFCKAAWMKSHGGEHAWAGDELVRYWRGADADTLLCYGKYQRLSAGAYRAVLRYRAAEPGDSARPGHWKIMSNQATVELAKAPLEEAHGFIEAVLNFELSAKTEVEPQVIGGSAELWIDSIRVEPASLP